MKVSFLPDLATSLDLQNFKTGREDFKTFLDFSLVLAKENPYGHGLDWIVLKKLAECAPILKEDEIFAAIETIGNLLQITEYDFQLRVFMLAMLIRPLVTSPLMEADSNLRENYIIALHEKFDSKTGLFDRSLLSACFLHSSFSDELLLAADAKKIIPLIKTIYDVLNYWNEKEKKVPILANVEVISKVIAKADTLRVLNAESRDELGNWLVILLINQPPKQGYFSELLSAKFTIDESINLLLRVSKALTFPRRVVIWKDLLQGINNESPGLIFLYLQPVCELILSLELIDQKKAMTVIQDELAIILCRTSQEEIEKEMLFVKEENRLSILITMLDCELTWLKLCRLIKNETPSLRLFFKSYIFKRALGIAFHEEYRKNTTIQKYLAGLIEEIKEEFIYPLSMTEIHILLRAFFHFKQSSLDVLKDDMLGGFFRIKIDTAHHLRIAVSEYFLKKAFINVSARVFLKQIKRFKSLGKKEFLKEEFAEDILIAFIVSDWASKAHQVIKLNQKKVKWPIREELESLVTKHLESLQKCALEHGMETFIVLNDSYSLSEEAIMKFLIILGRGQKLSLIKESIFEKFIRLYRALEGTHNNDSLLFLLYKRIFSGQIITILSFKEIYKSLIDPKSIVFNPENLQKFFNDLTLLLKKLEKPVELELAQVAYILLIYIGKGLIEIPRQCLRWSVKEKVSKNALKYDVTALGWSSAKRALLNLMQICYVHIQKNPEKKMLAQIFLREQINLLHKYRKYFCYPDFKEEGGAFFVEENRNSQFPWGVDESC